MASSTTRPTATANPPRVMMLMLMPATNISDQRGQDRDRDADRRHQGGAQVQQEEEDRDDREEGTEAAFTHQAVARLDDERRRVRITSIWNWPGFCVSSSLRRSRAAWTMLTVLPSLVLVTEMTSEAGAVDAGT